MTCIVAVRAPSGVIWMGGDSAAVEGYDLRLRKDPKVFRVGEFLIGYTSSFRMGQLLRFGFAPPDQIPGTDPYEYMINFFVPMVRAVFKEGGYSTVTNGQEAGGHFLVGYRGELYHVEGDFQVGIPLDGFAAAGCGDQIAVGALFATQRLSPKQRIITALEASERFSAGVRGPFTVLKLPAPR